jgi:hypothetical protein
MSATALLRQVTWRPPRFVIAEHVLRLQEPLSCVTFRLMPRLILSFLVAAFLACCLGAAQAVPKRTIACKTPANAASCYRTRGRLSFYNGTPAFRLWKVGTHRLLGIFSGPSADRDGDDNEHPEFPPNIEIDPFHLFEHQIFAEFEICPLEQERPRAMQAACVESAKNVFVEKLEK